MVGKEGWSGATLRFFERVSQPRVEFSRDSFGRSYPVEQSWDNLPLRRLIDAKVRVLDRHNEKLDIPDEQLDRKSVGKGQRGSERVDLGGRRIIKKKKTKI